MRVVVDGNVLTPTSLILAKVGSQTGKPFLPAQINEDVRSVAALDRFVSVRGAVKTRKPTATGNGVVVRFVVGAGAPAGKCGRDRGEPEDR